MTKERRPWDNRLRTMLMQTRQTLCTGGLFMGLLLTEQACAAKATGPLRDVAAVPFLQFASLCPPVVAHRHCPAQYVRDVRETSGPLECGA